MAVQHWPNDELTALANRFDSDKGTRFHCAHGYTRVYQALLAPLRERAVRIGEIGLVHGITQAQGPEKIASSGCSSLAMWADYLPRASIYGMDIVDFTGFASERIRIVQGDQGNRADLERFARLAGGFDVLIDDGSHASHHQQISLGALFPFVEPGGYYIIEDLHYQPADLELTGITTTRDFLRSLAGGRTGMHLAFTQAEYAYLTQQIESIHFFDSLSWRWPLDVTADALAVIRKRGGGA